MGIARLRPLLPLFAPPFARKMECRLSSQTASLSQTQTNLSKVRSLARSRENARKKNEIGEEWNGKKSGGGGGGAGRGDAHYADAGRRPSVIKFVLIRARESAYLTMQRNEKWRRGKRMAALVQRLPSET